MRKTTATIVAAGGALALATAAAATPHDPALDIPLNVGSLSLAGAQTINVDFNVPAGPGPVVGLSFSGFYEGPSSFGGDLKMEVSGPSGSTYSVGGFDNPGQFDWDFGSFTGTMVQLDHQTFKEFQPGGTTDVGGVWDFDFTLDWASSPGHNWSNVTVTLHRIPSPGSAALLALAGIAAARRRR